jgi:hypothetical protein
MTISEVRSAVASLDEKRRTLSMLPTAEFARHNVHDALRPAADRLARAAIPDEYPRDQRARDIAVANADDLLFQWREACAKTACTIRGGCCGR